MQHSEKQTPVGKGSIRVRSAVAAMSEYHPPIEGRVEQDYLLLDFSESTVPPSPHVLQAMQDYLAGGKVRMYPAYGDLSEKLARYVGVTPEQLLVTNGSDGAIQLILRAVLEPGDEIVLPKPYFSVIGSTAESLAAKLVCPPYRPDYSFPFEEVLAAVTPKTRMIVVINPNNPTGTSASLEQVETLLKRFPDVAIYVDEAYYEFSGVTAVPLLKQYGNLVISRTFSKAMAMAGLRFGYAVAEPGLIRQLYKLRIPYDVNSLAVVAAAASLDHPEPWQSYVREVMQRAKPLVERFLTEHGVPFVKSDCNFMMVRDDDPERVYGYLKARDILVRPQRQAPQYFRVSVGTVEEMRRFLQVYGEYLDQLGKPASCGAATTSKAATDFTDQHGLKA
jgi:histidinol-phosphate aminotransferase